MRTWREDENAELTLTAVVEPGSSTSCRASKATASAVLLNFARPICMRGKISSLHAMTLVGANSTDQRLENGSLHVHKLKLAKQSLGVQQLVAEEDIIVHIKYNGVEANFPPSDTLTTQQKQSAGYAVCVSARDGYPLGERRFALASKGDNGREAAQLLPYVRCGPDKCGARQPCDRMVWFLPGLASLSFAILWQRCTHARRTTSVGANPGPKCSRRLCCRCLPGYCLPCVAIFVAVPEGGFHPVVFVCCC